jgi:hypothetical protein
MGVEVDQVDSGGCRGRMRDSSFDEIGPRGESLQGISITSLESVSPLPEDGID